MGEGRWLGVMTKAFSYLGLNTCEEEESSRCKASSWLCCSGGMRAPMRQVSGYTCDLQKSSENQGSVTVSNLNLFFKNFFFFLLPHPQHMEVPGPGTESEPQLQPIWQMRDPSPCNRILNPLHHSKNSYLNLSFFLFLSFFFYFFFSFWGCTCSIWTFPGQGSNQSCSCQPAPQPQQNQIWAASLEQCWILNTLSKTRGQTCILTETRLGP